LNAGHEAEVFYGSHQAVAAFFSITISSGPFGRGRPVRLRRRGAPAGLAGLAALYACYSRGAAVGLGVGALAFAWALPRRLA